MQRRVFWLLLLLPWLTGGCTAALWKKNSLDAYHKPAPVPHLRLYHALEHQDILAVYDEISERDRSQRTRAYFLYQNDGRIAREQKPVFVATNLSSQLPTLPVLQNLPGPGTNTPAGLYAVLNTNQTAFTLFTGQHALNSHHLPHYPDAVGDIERVALTPLALSVDVTFGVVVVACMGASEVDVSDIAPKTSDDSGSHTHHPPHPHDTDQTSAQPASPAPDSSSQK